MSFGGIKLFNGVLDGLVLLLMLVSMLAIFYAPIDFSYKIGIGVMAFIIFLLISIATTILRQQKELREQQLKQA